MSAGDALACMHAWRPTPQTCIYICKFKAVTHAVAAACSSALYLFADPSSTTNACLYFELHLGAPGLCSRCCSAENAARMIPSHASWRR